MANYTIELGEVIKQGYKLALDDYPIFDEAHRPILNDKIIAHYYFREIGLETPDRFNHYLRMKMHEIMPLYNQLYESQLWDFDPLSSEYIYQTLAAQVSKDKENVTKNKQKIGESVLDTFAGNKDTNSTSNLNNDFTEDTTGDFTTDGKTTGEYTKSGDKTTETVSDGTYEKEGEKNSTTDSNGSYSKTGDKNVEGSESHSESVTEDIDSNSVTTNDLQTTNNTKNDGTGDNVTQGMKNAAMSNMPQNYLATGIAVDPATGNAELTLTGYATTNNQEVHRNTDKTTTHEESDSITKNTGTVETDGTSHRTNELTGSSESTTDDTWNESGSDTNHSETKETYKEDGSDHNKTDGNELWNEKGSDSGTSNTVGNTTGNTTSNEKEDTSAHENVKDDNQRNTKRDEQIKNDTKANEKSLEANNETVTIKGRRGMSPAELLKQYRDYLINVDMMIISDLEILFMGVF